MDEALESSWPMANRDRIISDAVAREGPRLRNFIRKHVADPLDAEDILQDVYYELVEAQRLMHPVDHLAAWLYRVARNRITDLFRRKSREKLRFEAARIEEGERLLPDEFLRSQDAGPEEAYARRVLMQALDDALDELPPEQREVFIAHELMGYSFKELSETSGLSVNTLLARKHYAVLRLRERLRDIYDEFAKR